jgi:hypothetical protein
MRNSTKRSICRAMARAMGAYVAPALQIIRSVYHPQAPTQICFLIGCRRPETAISSSRMNIRIQPTARIFRATSFIASWTVSLRFTTFSPEWRIQYEDIKLTGLQVLGIQTTDRPIFLLLLRRIPTTQ